MATKIRKTTWNTYLTTCYTHAVAQDQRSADGVHHHQVRYHRGRWQHRVEQSNGTYSAAGPTEDIEDEDGEARFERAKAY